MSDDDEYFIPPDLTAQPFFCPNCRSRNCGGFAFVSPQPFRVGRPFSPWQVVQQICFCADCDATIPAHLAGRWQGATEEDVIHEWENIYRDRAYDASPAGGVWVDEAAMEGRQLELETLIVELR